jgi:D-arabinose 1-dehydrogenase-like Zn-dependent alcohol dehydrogenase
MRAARFESVGKPLAVHVIPVPRPAAEEVLVRVAATGLCGSDVHIAMEGITPTPCLPITLGHEIAGTVAAVGDDVTGWSVDERVCVFPLTFDGTCATCLAGHSEICLNRRVIGIHSEGGLAEYVAVPARNLAAVPDDVPFPQAAICTDAVITPFHALTDVARLAPGESVVVIGAGGLGLHAVQIAKLTGASPVIAVDTRAVQLERARQGGADVVVDVSADSVVDAVLAATAGVGVDVAAEFIGTQATIGQAVECLRIGGRAGHRGTRRRSHHRAAAYRLRAQAAPAARLLRGDPGDIAASAPACRHQAAGPQPLDHAHVCAGRCRGRTEDPAREDR